MLVLLDTNENLSICAGELGCDVGQLLTPLTRFTLQNPDLPWAMDNGAFSHFEEKSFLSLLQREEHHKANCLFVAVPDVVGSARRTLEIFDRWKARLATWPVALVLQDGQQDLPIPWDDIAAVFIGGSTEFKLSSSAAQCIKAAKILGKWAHVGRVNDPARFTHFEALGADSIDGTGVSRYSHMRRAISKRDWQEKMFTEEAPCIEPQTRAQPVQRPKVITRACVVPESACPACGQRFDRATCTTGDHAPKPGDLTMCISCGVVLQFTESLHTAQLSTADLDALDAETRAHLAKMIRLRAELAEKKDKA